VFAKSGRLNLIFSIIAVFAIGIASACSGGGLGCGCGSAPLPGGALPADQTVEGGAQVRITPAGMTKVNQLISSMITGAFGGGFCVGEGSIGGSALGFDYCDTNPGGACGGGRGCDVNVNIDYLNTSVVNANTLNIETSVDLSSAVHLDGSIVFIPFSCTLGVDMQNIVLDADIQTGIRASDGELTITLAQVNNTDFSNVNFSGCSVLSDIIDLVFDVLDTFIGDLLIDLFTPTLNDLVQGFLPDPLGIEGMIDLGSMLAGVSPGTEALMEGRIVPGGYVSLNGGGMTLGIITGINADEDINSRSPDLDSEPALCVPPFAAPNYAGQLPVSSRNTFRLDAAGAFSGAPDPAGDLAMGVSETTLDLFGHHMVSSGGMCLGLGTAFAPQLNLGTIGILVPSLSELGTDGGDDPLLLVTRPQHPLDFTIGDGTTTPNLTVKIDSLEVDFYAFLYERYTRAFTLVLTLDAGVNFTVDNSVNPPTLTPVLTGLTADEIEIQVINSEFVRETAAELEAVLPSVFDLALPLIADGIGPIDMPDFGGFSLNNVSLGKITTSQDDFLAINATLGATTAMRLDPRFAEVVADLDAAIGPVLASASTGTARLVEVHTPSPESVRAALRTAHGVIGTAGEMPSVTIDTDRTDGAGRSLEWSWRLNGGLWRPFTTASPLVIADRAFAWQGKYKIGLRSRVVGDTRTESHDVIDIPVIIDSVPPALLEAQVAWDGDTLSVPAFDLVSRTTLAWAYAAPGADVPATPWFSDERVARATIKALMENDEIQVFIKDEAGNTQVALARPFHGQAGESGCNCDASGGPGAGSLLLILITGGVLVLRRRGAARHALVIATRVAPTVALWLGIAVVVSLAPGCSCSSKPTEQACETVEDCAGFCEGDDIAFCIDGTCVCSDDIPPGKIGPYSDVAGNAAGTAWVSAYAQSHGDLVVARVDLEGRIPDTTWEWVDGVPDGPIEIPGAMIRGGISAAGPDVGMYTSIAVSADGNPMVTYFDRDTGSLKFAQKIGDVWQSHVVEAGVGPVEDIGGTIAGMYTALSARSDDYRPGVAYLRHINIGGVITAEVRWASAQSATPTSAADWTFWTVDEADIPPEDPNSPDVFPLPGGLGLFIDAARGPDQAPVVVYYDRAEGDLKFARFDATGGTFQTPVILDGATGDAGWSPTVGVDAAGVVHVAYVGASYDDLQYIRSDAPTTIETIDNGYRIVGTTEDGLPKPEFHFVGDDATMVMTTAGPTVAYQDATTHELLLAQRHETTGWNHITIAGAETPFIGAYGFFASASQTSSDLVISTWVLDQPNEAQWVEVFRRATVVQ
jgi:hypothetical protein